MLNWATFYYDCDLKRYELLSDFLNEQGISNQFHPVEIKPTDFLDNADEEMKRFDQVRVESPFRHTSFLAMKKHEAEMLVLRSGDTYFKDSFGVYWLRSAIYYGMEAILNGLNRPIDTEGAALIVGAGGGARAAISALVKAGMHTFNLTNAYDDQVLDLIKELKKVYFGIEFNFVSQGQLVLLPGANSVVVNSTPYRATNEIVNELAYFNFLKAPGMIWELSMSPIETELVVESGPIGAAAIRGHEFASQTDKRWTQWVAPELAGKVDFDKYTELLYENFGPGSEL
ncbi:MAG: hypothetical protein AAF202_07785, partial [Pseudomonadota bacterium]